VRCRSGCKGDQAAEREIDEGTSEFIAWEAKHDVDVTDHESSKLRLDFGVVDDIRKILREGFDLWREADMPESRYRMANIHFEEEIASDLKYVDKTETKLFAATAWHYLD
jgi:hypothetical protein